MPKLSSVLLVLLLGLCLSGSAAAAEPAAGTGDGLGVITAVSATPTTVTTNFFFTGTQATGFVLAVPRQATLSTLSPGALARDMTLSTVGGHKVHYILLSARANYLAVALHSPQPDLRLQFKRTLFTFSAAESRQISARRVRAIHMGIAFSGGPGQLVASKFTFAVTRLR